MEFNADLIGFSGIQRYIENNIKINKQHDNHFTAQANDRPQAPQQIEAIGKWIQ